MAPPVFTLALVGSEYLASRPGRFTPGEIPTGPRTSLDNVERKISFSCRDSNSDPSAIQPVVTPIALCRLMP
jgi:hypothetical protein